MNKRKYKIIGSIFCHEDPVDTLIEMETAKKAGVDIIEIRYDTEQGTFRPDPMYYQHYPQMEIISTCMTKKDGGYSDGTLGEWASLLKEAVDLDTHYISVGLKQAKTQKGREVIGYTKKHLLDVGIMVADHGQSMPPKEKIIKTLEEEKTVGADIAKVAYEANNPEDVLEIIKATLYDLGIPKIMIAMGKYGKFWRAVSLVHPWNCWGMFASVGKSTAAGQLNVKEIKDILNILDKE